jgi:menaquinone-dependent protoporphyrinogen oxidase
MGILVLYGTSEGQTRKIAEFCADRLREQGLTALTVDARQTSDLDPTAFEAAIIASRIRAGRHPRSVIAFVRRYRSILASVSTLFLPVSMSAARQDPDDARRLAQYLRRFVQNTGWTPERVHDVAGARLYRRHGRIARWILGLVDHNRYDTSRDHEFTDWGDLGKVVADWAASVRRRRQSEIERGSLVVSRQS